MIRIAFWLVQDSIHHWANWIAGLYYVRHCLEAIAALPDEERPSVVAFAPESLVPMLLESPTLVNASWLTTVPISDEHRTTSRGLTEFATIVDSHQCDVLFPAISPPCIPFQGKILAWITDYQHKYYPEFFPESELSYRDQMFSFMTAISTRIICSSESVREDLYRFYPRSSGRGSVLRFTTSPPDSALDADASITLQRLSINEPYAYLPYQFWKHKNHWTAFKAWAVMANRGFHPLLVCSGTTNDSRSPEHFEELNKYLHQSGLAERVRILGMVSREDQWQLYRGAKFVLQPSLFEGWSTSVEEARSLGKPTVLSDISVHREQLEDSGHFFKALDSDDLAGVVSRLWKELPDGYDFASESRALAKNPDRLLNFGRALASTFRDAMESGEPSIGCDVLPLYLYMQQEANERLKVIRQLEEHHQYLTGVIEEKNREIAIVHESLSIKTRELESAVQANAAAVKETSTLVRNEEPIVDSKSSTNDESFLRRVKRLFS